MTKVEPIAKVTHAETRNPKVEIRRISLFAVLSGFRISFGLRFRISGFEKALVGEVGNPAVLPIAIPSIR